MKTRSSDVQSPPAPALLSRLAEKAWSLAYDIPDLTFIQPPDPVREMTTLASDRKPWIIIRQAVSQELCIKAVEELRESPPTPHNHPSFLQYKPTATCITIADLNHEKFKSEVSQFGADAARVAVNALKFRKLDRPSARTSGKVGEIYFVTALTRLSNETGMFALSDCQEAGEDVTHKAGARVPVLEVGDAVIWTRETAGRTTKGEEGFMHIIVFQSKNSSIQDTPSSQP